MHVENILRTHGGKTYRTCLLRQSYREEGKVKKRTLANLSHLPESVIELIRAGLRGEHMFSAEQDLHCVGSLAHGSVHALLGVIKGLRLDKVIYSRNTPEQRLVTAMVAARLLKQGSKRFSVNWWQYTTLPEELDLPNLPKDGEDVNLLYEAMGWALERQPAIQKALAARHLQEGCLVLYDLASSYLEGRTCPLGAFGHSRDGKLGKLQFTYGLLTDGRGCPVAIEVFGGSVADPKTVMPQVERLQKGFGFGEVVFVGDRGMIAKTRIEDLRGAGLSWITALKAKEIQRLRASGILQMSLFDERDMAEIYDPEWPGERLVVCRNPSVGKERERKREELLKATETELEKVRRSVEAGRLTEPAQMGLRVGKVLNRWKMAKHFEIDIQPGRLAYERGTESILREKELDGICVIRTNVASDRLGAEKAVAGCKSLARVEQAFRQMKSFLEIRPVYDRLEDRVKAHAFLYMLAYYVQWHMEQALKPMLDEGKESLRTVLASLEAIRRDTMELQSKRFSLVTRPDDKQARILSLLNVSVP